MCSDTGAPHHTTYTGFAVPGDKSRGGKAFGVEFVRDSLWQVGLLRQRILFERVFEMGEEFGGFFRVRV